MITKKCTICKIDLPLSTEFFATRNDKKTLVFQSSCRECHKEYRKIHYEKNKEKYIQKAALYTNKIKDWFKEFKKTLKCEKCGENRYWVLDFHHINPLEKDLNISFLVNLGSKSRLEKEIKKCKVLCANCHRDLHYKEKQAGNA